MFFSVLDLSAMEVEAQKAFGLWPGPWHYGTKPGHFEASNIHFPTSERCERTSERMSEWPSTYISILG